MTEHDVNTMHEAAAHLLDALERGRPVTLEITARDAATGGLLRLLSAIHEAATARRLGIVLTPAGERGVRLTLDGRTGEAA